MAPLYSDAVNTAGCKGFKVYLTRGPGPRTGNTSDNSSDTWRRDNVELLQDARERDLHVFKRGVRFLQEQHIVGIEQGLKVRLLPMTNMWTAISKGPGVEGDKREIGPTWLVSLPRARRPGGGSVTPTGCSALLRRRRP